MKIIINSLFVLIILLITVTAVFAQPGLPTDPSQAPIDGGLGLLALGGGVYAWKKIKERKQA